MTPEYDERDPQDAPKGYASFVPAAKGAQRTRGDGRGSKPGAGKTSLIIGGVVLAALVLVYVAGAVVFMDRFMPNTSILSKDISLKTSAEVQDMVSELVETYTLDVTGQDFTLQLTADDLGMGINAESVTEAIHADTNPWAWPVAVFGSRDETDKITTSNDKLDTTVREAVDAFNKEAEPPRDAQLTYESASSQFVVQPETIGGALEPDRVVEAVDGAVAALASSLELTEEALQKPSLFSTDERLIKAKSDANELLEADFSLQLADATVGQVNAEQVANWVVLQEDITAGINEDAVAAWVQDIASACNTYQGKRTYTRADGKEVTVSGGVYGWIVDKPQLQQVILEGITSAQTGEVAVPCEQEAGAYNGLQGRDWGNRYIDIDLSEQHARFYDSEGALVWESDVVTGKPDGNYDTPEGVYVINNKESPSKLIGAMKPETGKPEYTTEVQTWMPFVDNIIGLHDAEWQSAFGGSRYKSGYGSHGCVNLPPDKASELYNLIEVGDVVVSHW